MKIRFFKKKTKQDVKSPSSYVVDSEGKVFRHCFYSMSEEGNILLRTSDVGWEIIKEETK